MAINRQALKLLDQLATEADKTLSADLVKLVLAWSRAWSVVEREWRAVVEDLAREIAAGGRPRRKTLANLHNVQAAMNSAQAQLEALASLTSARAVATTRALIQSAAAAQTELIAVQLPRGSEARTAVEAVTDLPNRQLEALVRRTTSRIESKLRPLSADATSAMLDALLKGAARGRNPRVIAATMLRNTRDGFDGGLTRALNISRTEALDAHRSAAQITQNEHSDVLAEWQWLAHLEGTRTCPACWSKHGTLHPLTEPGPWGHQQCRCSRAPVTKTWRELGIDLDEPPSAVRDGQTQFFQLPKAQQLEIMGPTRLQGLEQGKILWEELATKRANPGWRDGFYATPVRDFKSRLYVSG